MASQPIDQVLRLGQEHHRAGRLTEAEGIYRQILARHPHQTDALLSLGALTLQAGRRAESIALFGKVIGARPHDLSTYLTVGQVLHVHGALDDAAHLYGHALELFPASDEVCYRLGHIERARHNPDDSIGWRSAARRPATMPSSILAPTTSRPSARTPGRWA